MSLNQFISAIAAGKRTEDVVISAKKCVEATEMTHCTFLKNGQTYIQGQNFTCETCNVNTDPLNPGNIPAMCALCAVKCHEGHKIKFVVGNRYYCDCGCGDVYDCECKCMGRTSVAASSTSTPTPTPTKELPKMTPLEKYLGGLNLSFPKETLAALRREGYDNSPSAIAKDFSDAKELRQIAGISFRDARIIISVGIMQKLGCSRT